MKSMTGYGRGCVQQGEYSIVVELSSVNRKSLEVHCSIPREWQSLERELQESVRKCLHRGKINLSLQFSGGTSVDGFPVDRGSIGSTLEALKAVSLDLGVHFEPNADLLFRIATALRGSASALPDVSEFSDSIFGALKQALATFVSMRETEGRALSEDLKQRLGQILSWVEQIEKEAPSRPEHYKTQLLERLNQLGLNVDFNDERVLKEVAIFADRCDVSEEITRLKSHLVQMQDCLSLDEPVGRKMDFLCQEVFRELNTIGSKANGLDITKYVIECKNELERIREQVQNIE